MGSEQQPGKGKRLNHRLAIVLGLLVAYLLVAYLVLPFGWRSWAKRHPALDEASRITHTGNGIPGDPLNLALVGSEEEIQAAMLAAKWNPADPITMKSSLRIATGTVFHKAYDAAPVSNLFLFARKQDLAFEQPVGNDPRRRHHVRFWRAEKLDESGRPMWFGAATFDTRVGFSHTTGQVTHHVSADVDQERDKIMDDCQQAGRLSDVYWIDSFHEKREGKNGGGDPWHTDGRLAVGVTSIRVPVAERAGVEGLLLLASCLPRRLGCASDEGQVIDEALAEHLPRHVIYGVHEPVDTFSARTKVAAILNDRGLDLPAPEGDANAVAHVEGAGVLPDPGIHHEGIHHFSSPLPGSRSDYRLQTIIHDAVKPPRQSVTCLSPATEFGEG